VAEAILNARRAPTADDYARQLRSFGRRYPDAGYGSSFRRWTAADRAEPYNSWGNGSAMRASAVGWAFDSEEDVLRQAELTALPTHNHPEGIKGAQAVALAVFMARKGVSKEKLRASLSSRFDYDLGRTVESIRPNYGFEVSCQASVPEAVIAFLDSADFEDAVRNAISLGGDADTQACVAGAIAEAFYRGVPPRVLAWVLPRLEDGLLETLDRFARAHLPTAQSEAVRAERAARTLPRGAYPGSGRNRNVPVKPGAERPASRPLPRYSIVLHGETRARLSEYALRLGKNPRIAGALLALNSNGNRCSVRTPLGCFPPCSAPNAPASSRKARSSGMDRIGPGTSFDSWAA
jgi:hypothetical protein